MFFYDWYEKYFKEETCSKRAYSGLQKYLINFLQFSMHSSLAVIVQSIIDEFKAHPPQLQSHNL